MKKKTATCVHNLKAPLFAGKLKSKGGNISSMFALHSMRWQKFQVKVIITYILFSRIYPLRVVPGTRTHKKNYTD